MRSLSSCFRSCTSMSKFNAPSLAPCIHRELRLSIRSLCSRTCCRATMYWRQSTSRPKPLPMMTRSPTSITSPLCTARPLRNASPTSLHAVSPANIFLVYFRSLCLATA
eukprot:Amastigsp_a176958_48.p5 type:complete len:109 gc:universal Amastigsp_a176958_48:777-1103(+)